MTETKYPIYSVSVRWVQDVEGDPHPRSIEGLPPGRMRNVTGWNKMYREEQDLVGIDNELRRDRWPNYKKGNNPSEPIIEIKLLCWDTWCSGWFSHYTFDVGLDDAAVLASFERYVDRIQFSDRSETEKGGLLMGAEDRWRWHGYVDGNPQSERTEAPCRCPECKKQGLVRIDH